MLQNQLLINEKGIIIFDCFFNFFIKCFFSGYGVLL